MSSSAVTIRGISKCYAIYENPRDRLKQFVLPKVRHILGFSSKQYFHEFWALQDISLEIRKGETVGIIGKNGSGKSTLLQIICGTLSPTKGQIETRGRIAALLELGAGFNPEFTGRENVYMNAALLGLSKQQINDRFADIEAFADIGEFIEQPVKTYSSGMYVRLAFAVIAHVDADILIIDEALAVGDAIFTQKCMRFLRRFKENGTLLFVSHDTSAVLSLCDKAIWLEQGKVKQAGRSKEVAEAYLQHTLQIVYGSEAKLSSVTTDDSTNTKKNSGSEAHSNDLLFDYESKCTVINNLSEANGWKTGAGEIISVHIENIEQPGKAVFEGGETVKLCIKAIAHEELNKPILGFVVRDKLGQDLFGENTLPFTNLHPRKTRPNCHLKAEFTFQLPMLPNGQYVVMASLANGEGHDHIQHHWLHDALIINVSSSKVRFGLVGIPFTNVVLDHCE